MSLAADPRWIKLTTVGVACSCGDRHQGVFPVSKAAPAGWSKPAVYEPNKALRTDGDFLSEDFCVIGGEFFAIRCTLDLPIKEAAELMRFGVWAAVSKEDFGDYLRAFDLHDGKNGEAFGRLMDKLEGYYDTYALDAALFAQDNYQRPKMVLRDGPHPLIGDQRQGISFNRLLELYAAAGHDIRPALRPN